MRKKPVTMPVKEAAFLGSGNRAAIIENFGATNTRRIKR